MRIPNNYIDEIGQMKIYYPAYIEEMSSNM